MQLPKIDEKALTDCYFFMEKECTKPSCTFRHFEKAKSSPVVCSSWLGSQCFNATCHLLHPTKTPAVFKSLANKIPCFYNQQGQCAKGDICPYYHGEIPSPLEEINQILENKSKPKNPSLSQKKEAVKEAPKVVESANKVTEDFQVRITSDNLVIKKVVAPVKKVAPATKKSAAPAIKKTLVNDQAEERKVPSGLENPKQKKSQQKNKRKNSQEKQVGINKSISAPTPSTGGSMFGVKSLKDLHPVSTPSALTNQTTTMETNNNNKKRSSEETLFPQESSKKQKIFTQTSVFVTNQPTENPFVSHKQPVVAVPTKTTNKLSHSFDILSEDEKFLLELEKEVAGMKKTEEEFDDKEIEALLNQDF